MPFTACPATRPYGRHEPCVLKSGHWGSHRAGRHRWANDVTQMTAPPPIGGLVRLSRVVRREAENSERT